MASNNQKWLMCHKTQPNDFKFISNSKINTVRGIMIDFFAFNNIGIMNI